MQPHTGSAQGGRHRFRHLSAPRDRPEASRGLPVELDLPAGVAQVEVDRTFVVGDTDMDRVLTTVE